MILEVQEVGAAEVDKVDGMQGVEYLVSEKARVVSPMISITASIEQEGIAPCFVELCEAVVAVNDVKRPSQFGQERDCLFPFRSERQARAAMPEVACKL